MMEMLFGSSRLVAIWPLKGTGASQDAGVASTPLPARPLKGLFLGGRAVADNGGGAGEPWDAPLSDEPGGGIAPSAAYPPKQGQPVWEAFTELLRSLISERGTWHKQRPSGWGTQGRACRIP